MNNIITTRGRFSVQGQRGLGVNLEDVDCLFRFTFKLAVYIFLIKNFLCENRTLLRSCEKNQRLTVSTLSLVAEPHNKTLQLGYLCG